MYSDPNINPSNRNFKSTELDRNLDDILEGRINRNTLVNKPNTQSKNNVLPALGRKPRQRKKGPKSFQPILDGILELPDNPNTQSISNYRPSSGKKAERRTNGPRSGQPILDNVLELPGLPNTQSISNVRPASGRKPNWTKNGPRSGQPILDNNLGFPNARSASSVYPASGRQPSYQTNNTRPGQPIRDNVLELPDAPSAIPKRQSQRSPAPTYPPAHIPYGNHGRAFGEFIDGPQRSVPWGQRIRPKPQLGPSRLDQDSIMEDAPPVQPTWPGKTITQPGRHGPRNGKPSLRTPNNRPTQGLPFDHDLTMADAPPASNIRPHKNNDQRRMPVPIGPRSPAPNFIPASATHPGPAFPHGKVNQPGMPMRTEPWSNKGLTPPSNPPAFSPVRTNQPVVSGSTGPRQDVRPAPNFIPASASQSGPAFPHSKANKPIVTVPNGPRSNKGYVKNGQPKMPAPIAQSGPAFPHGKENQRGITVPTRRRSYKSHVKHDQPRLPTTTAPSSHARPVLPSQPVANSWDPASPRARLGHTSPAPNISQAPRTQPASAAPSSPASIHPRKRPWPEPKAPNIVSGHNPTPNSGLQSSSSTYQESKIVEDHPAVGKGLDKKENQKTTIQRPEGAPSTHSPQFHSAQSFAEAPSAQTSQQAPQSSFLSSPSVQTAGTSFAPDSTQASHSQRVFTVSRMRIVENAVTVRSGYALFPSVGGGLDKMENQRTGTIPRPEGAPSTNNSHSHAAQFFAEVPSAQTSQQTPQSSFLSSPSIQKPGISSAPDSQASHSQRDFKIIRMRIVENAVTVRSGYALLWV